MRKKRTPTGRRFVTTAVTLPVDVADDIRAIASAKEWHVSHVSRKVFEQFWPEFLLRYPDLGKIVRRARNARGPKMSEVELEQIENEISVAAEISPSYERHGQ